MQELVAAGPRDSEEGSGRIGTHVEMELTGFGGLGRGNQGSSWVFYLSIWEEGMWHLLLSWGRCLGWRAGF